MENQTDTYQTSDIRISSYLLTAGIPLIRVVKDDPRKIVFCFSPSSKTQSLIQKFWTNQAKCNPRELYDNMDYLKGLIYNDYSI